MRWIVAIFMIAATMLATAICFITLQQIRCAPKTSAKLTKLGYWLVLRSGIAVAALYGLGQALASLMPKDTPSFIGILLQESVSAGAWLVPLVFAGVGVSVMASGLAIESPENQTMDAWLQSLPRWVRNAFMWLNEHLGKA